MRKTFCIAATGDVHGMLYPYDFTTLTPAPGSLARVSAYISGIRSRLGDDRVLLLDNGDMLQGQPTVYFYNFIATGVTHPVARMMQYLRYDAQTVGNHDIETGHPVYDRHRADREPIPLHGPTVTATATGQPYFRPYTVIERDGVRFAILGLLTPAIPAWLPAPLWEGMEVQPLVESARRWVEHIRATEHPDLIIGLFHSGYASTHLTWKWLENASGQIADEVEGLDIIFMGHDHLPAVLTRPSGVVMLNPGAHAMSVAEATVEVEVAADGRVTVSDITAALVPLSDYEPDPEFLTAFEPERLYTLSQVERVIGHAAGDFSVRDAYFGPSAFMELIHTLQLEVSGADISIAAPTSFDASLRRGPLRMSDMFTLYRYENQLCTLAMTGREIKNLLEMSYNLWTAVMHSADDPLLKFADGNSVKGDYSRLINPTYNFDSAHGINYTVDVTRPKGEKITILSMSDGSAFDPDHIYKVAVNAYRANGGGELITRGAGIKHDDLPARRLDATTLDLRYYLMKAIERRGTITPTVTHNWRFIPTHLVAPAVRRDRARLFADENL
ncbi:MAG: bifunctional metallophosphatase/5'-nucleotidase [Bacteroides sp.]|nr:bifunctional metallophosphatase/5'-nucleotidase [Bacteroides sp.]